MAAGRPRVVVVAGPTASGKSALAEALARRLGGQVVNADSVQLYGAFRILTARPTVATERRLPHRLYGILGPVDRCSAGRWRSLALDAVAEGHAAGRPSVLVGGSGLYLEALLRGFSPIPCVPPSVRRDAVRRLDAIGPAALHDELRKVDPVLAGRLEPGDRQRIVRGWEVWLATGRPLSSWQASAQHGGVVAQLSDLGGGLVDEAQRVVGPAHRPRPEQGVGGPLGQRRSHRRG